MIQVNHYDGVIIGAGIAGLYLVKRLRDDLGLNIRVFETGSDVGGTWYWNRYPGARCDVESMFYSYSFDADLQEEWDWNERYASQPEILAYVNHVADRFDLRRSIDFDTSVTRASFDDASASWSVVTDRGDTVTARYLISAVGCLSAPNTPTLPGLESFKGDIYHTGSWPFEHVDFSGKRVGVIGTGSSGIQAIPPIAEQAAELTVFQRTPTYSVPANNRPLTDVERKRTKRLYPALRSAALSSRLGVLQDQPIGIGYEVVPEVAQGELERRWWTNAVTIPTTFHDSLTDRRSNEIIAEFVRQKISEIVTDAQTAESLQPNAHAIGTKRIVLDTDYYETYNRPNVRLVDLRASPLTGFTAHTVRAGAEEFPVDALVLATGYDAMTGALNKIDIVGSGGLSLQSQWNFGPQTYLGIMVADFPNFFTVTGPGSPSVLTNMVMAIEQHVDWITDLISYCRTSDVIRVEATSHAQDAWSAHVAELADATLLPSAASWFTGANIPGKPRVFMAYISGLGSYRKICDAEARAGYPNLSMGSGPTSGRSKKPQQVVDRVS